ncbi:TonB-dependent receptor [Rhodoferax sp.]|uniref:TonB-dependent receptor n=1 Tax=Rhodoferax sp. TaxID=50421 RepID=UPI0025EACE9F|nr:TonB-dependent receptor [Rhodoferax sp.]
MKKLSFALLSLGSLSAAAVFGQTSPAATLAPITVTGNLLGATDLIAPVAQYAGAELLFRTQSTLGETLDGTPGISSTYFGPNASRPIIRGLDGDRIRILNNGGAVVDASSLSYDHAVTVDPLSIERIEVLRGPGALQYGGSAVGGVVNVIDNRIPREAMFDANGGITGKVDVGLTSGNDEQGGGFLLEGGTDRYALHADVFNRTSGDVSVPVTLACSKPGAASSANKICNSASDTRGAAVGGSVFFKQGYLGASVSSFQSDYGTVAEDAVTIGMKSDRYALEGEVRDLSGWFQRVKGQLGHSVYQHTEYEGATAGTVFKNNGTDLRLEARHAPLGAFDGVLGLQSDTSRFSADGEEAFAPYSQTRQTALFAYEELATGWGRLSAGARLESVNVESLGNPVLARFAPASRSFTPGSYALGALWNVVPGWQLSTNWAYTQRAPKDYELFADGAHLATHTYEVGNANLALEQSSNLDLGVNWRHGAHRFGVSAFVNQFNNYIAQEATGNSRADLPEYAYTQVQARFTGLEASGSVRLLDSGQTLDLELRGDLVHAVNLSTGQPLPRIAPARAGATLLWAQGPWIARLGASHSTAQTDVPSGQLGTEAYTLWHASLGYRVKAGAANLLWFAKLDNLSDTLAYSASSILTQTAAGKAPLPGRSVKVGLQVSF